MPNRVQIKAANEPHYFRPDVKRGETPAGCVMNNPYCTCRAGRICALLPESRIANKVNRG